MKSKIFEYLIGGGAIWILSAAAHALPEPVPSESRFYLFFYRFTQNLLANFDKAKATK